MLLASTKPLRPGHVHPHECLRPARVEDSGQMDHDVDSAQRLAV
jgi:hypothetical protein